MADRKRDSLIVILAIVAVVVSVAAAGLTYFSIVDLTSRISGYATGTANLSVETTAQINFTNATLNWGSGRVNAGGTAAALSSEFGTVTGGNWTVVNYPLVIENIGNINVSLNITGSKTAAQFIGGTAPVYKWNVTSVEANSCLNATGASNAGLPLGVYYDVNTTSSPFCSVFQFIDTADTVRIHFNLTVPSDSLTGALGDVITATVIAN